MAWRGVAWQGTFSQHVAVSRRELRRTDARREWQHVDHSSKQSTNGGVFLFAAIGTPTRHDVRYLVLGKDRHPSSRRTDATPVADLFVEKTPGNER